MVSFAHLSLLRLHVHLGLERGDSGMSNEYAALAGNTLPTGVLVLGIFVMCISLVGCIGAQRESRGILGFVRVTKIHLLW